MVITVNQQLLLLPKELLLPLLLNPNQLITMVETKVTVPLSGVNVVVMDLMVQNVANLALHANLLMNGIHNVFKIVD
jgi:hypothetical protein